MRNPNAVAVRLSVLTLAVAGPASAATIHVNAAAPGGDGSSWASAFNDLQQALASATSGDSIWVARGVYKPTTGTDRNIRFNIPSGVKVYGGFAGGEASIDDRPADPDPHAADPAFDTILSGEIGAPPENGFADNTICLVNLQSTSSATTLDRLVFTRGTAGANFPFNRGGGVRTSSAAGTISDCLFIDNEAAEGGGLWLENSANFKVTNCRFVNNRSPSGYGGAVLHRFGSAEFVGCTFANNSAGIGGGAISLSFGAQATIRNSTFLTNFGSSGGGAIHSVSAGATTLVEDCTFDDNRASRQPVGANGGAVYNNSGSHTYRRCLFIRNQSQSAGAVSDQSGAATLYEDCEFRDNVCDVAGGAAAPTSAGVRFTRCLFDNNEGGTGGAMNASAAVTVEWCTFSNNFTHPPSNQGGAVAVGAGTVFTDCDFIANRANVAGAVYASGGRFERCRFADNRTNASGGALWHTGGTIDYINCLIVGTRGSLFGSAVYHANGTATFTNCTIFNNSGAGQALYRANGTLNVVNCIVRNPGTEFGGTVNVSYSNVEGGFAGTGNINADPLFVDASMGLYRLQPGSPCIDAGNNAAVPMGVATDLAGAPRFIDDPATADTGAGVPPIVDMGAYEFLPPPPPECLGDANGDLLVNFADVTEVLIQFGLPTTPGGPGDANHDGEVNFGDITAVLTFWGAECG